MWEEEQVRNEARTVGAGIIEEENNTCVAITLFSPY